MTDPEEGNLSFYRATIFMRALYESGLRHVVISPGSRSTPLTLAAATLGELEKHIVLDERSAAFTALGIGKATGRPAVLVCTSGTAAANYYPAVIEARQSGVPLLLATADRPARLRNTDANQTIDQLQLYGKFACEFKNLPESTGSEETLSRLKEVTKWAFERSTAYPGPVHLNFPFDKPLEPAPLFLENIRKENEGLPKITGIPRDKNRQAGTICRFTDSASKALAESEQPLIIIGQLPANKKVEPIFNLAQSLNAPVLSEQGIISGSTAIQGFEGFLGTEGARKELQPDLILRFGLQPASKSLLLALQNWSPKHHIYFSSSSNPRETALPVSESLSWDGNDFSLNGISPSPKGWFQTWKKKEKRYTEKKQKAFDAQIDLTDGHVYEHLSGQIPSGWSLFFSNSFPARDRSLFGDWSDQSVYTNRGASGIDGINSTALGIGIGSENPVILFTGDLAFLHDTNAMLNQKLLTGPLVIAVINNRGGSIFRMLPIANHSDYFTAYFETPQQADMAKLAASYDLPFKRIDSLKELDNFNLTDFITDSDHEQYLHIVEFQTNPDSSMSLRRLLWGSN